MIVRKAMKHAGRESRFAVQVCRFHGEEGRRGGRSVLYVRLVRCVWAGGRGGEGR